MDALVSLGDSLSALAEDHNQWQLIDCELRRIEAMMRIDTAELEMSWPGLKADTESLHRNNMEEWAWSFREASNQLDNAIAANNPTEIRERFRAYRRRANERFHKVDVNLKGLCEDLFEGGGALASMGG
jgi:hypothetical protein